MSEDKKKILVISDHPLSPSGVGIQTRSFIEALLDTGRYKFICFGGAIKHRDYSPVKVGDYGEDWVIHPVNGYGNQEMLRSAIRFEKPDAIWIMTDPRFYGWLWEIEDEVRSVVPLIYYHVWDNYPYPTYNKPSYESNDLIVSISKVTHDIVNKVAPTVDSIYHPHGVDSKVFKKMSAEEIAKFKEESMGEEHKDKFVFFWNSRNARRKQSGSLIFWYKKFLDIVGHDKAVLVMHTDIYDENGQDLNAIIKELGLINGEVRFSTNKLSSEKLAEVYNSADCTVAVSDAEGFGLSALESLSCGTPIMVTMTGGLQEQVTDGVNSFGIGMQPVSKAIIGSQAIPWIYEDRLSEEVVVDAMLNMFNLSKKEREKLGELGMSHVKNNYSYEKYKSGWVKIIDDAIEKYGSWETRSGYQAWKHIEV